MARPSRPWFRFYVEAVHDRKLRRQKPEHRWLFVACLAAARQSPIAGFLMVSERDPMNVEDLADFAGMNPKDVQRGMGELCRVGCVDRDLDLDAWFLPTWNDRQYESDDVTARTRKHRERSQEQDGNVPKSFSGTPPETEAETDTETESEVTPPAPLRAARKPATTDDPARLVVQAVWERCGDRKPVLPGRGNPFMAAVKIAEKFLAEGHDPTKLMVAMLEAHRSATISVAAVNMQLTSSKRGRNGKTADADRILGDFVEGHR